jgi:hypothetical protein
MRSSLGFVLLLLLSTACKKKSFEVPAPAAPLMHYINQNNITAGVAQTISLDLDNDGIKDLYFSSQLVGDPVSQSDKRQFLVTGAFNTFFAVNSSEQMPVLSTGDMISQQSFPQYEWYNTSQVVLAEKIITLTQPPYWQGQWKSANHNYIPLYIRKDDNIYFGWFELSFDTVTEKIILHSSAISKEKNKAVKAGSR